MGKAKAKSPVSAAAPPSPTSDVAPPSEKQDVGARLATLKKEATNMFISGEHAQALALNDEALSLLPAGSTLRVDVLLNKASNYLKLSKYKEAVVQCTTALELQPDAPRAMRWRSEALEKQGQYRAALADIQAVNKTDAATNQTRDVERRLRERIANRPASGGGGGVTVAAAAANGGGAAASAAAAAAARQRLQQQQQRVAHQQAQHAAAEVPAFPPQFFTAKVALGKDVRVVQFPPNGISYAQMQKEVAAVFPDAGPLVLKYEDRDHDIITIVCRGDLERALQELLHEFQMKLHASKDPHALMANGMPALRLQAVPVENQADVPVPPYEEVAAGAGPEVQQAYQEARRKVKEREASARAAALALPTQPQLIEVDNWLLEFAAMFQEAAGIAPGQAVDIQQLGWDKCTRAMEATLQSEKALPLFDQAAEKFREVTCTGLLSWGNVSMCLGHRTLDEAAVAGAPLGSVLDKVLEEFKRAETRYQEAMAYKADFFDGACALGQLEFERAKLRAGLLVAPVRPTPAAADTSSDSTSTTTSPAAATATAADGTSSDGAAAAAATATPSPADQAAAAAALAAGLARVTKADVDAAAALFDKADEWFTKALAMAPPDDAVKSKAKAEGGEAAEGSTEGAAAAAAADPEAKPEATSTSTLDLSTRNQGRIMHGNCLYEWSQLLAAVKPAPPSDDTAAAAAAATLSEWRPMLDRATALFRAAGCAEPDIRNALKNHTQAAALDLGPDPKPVVEAPTAPAAAPATPVADEVKTPEVKEAKGLPSMSRKK